MVFTWVVRARVDLGSWWGGRLSEGWRYLGLRPVGLTARERAGFRPAADLLSFEAQMKVGKAKGLNIRFDRGLELGAGYPRAVLVLEGATWWQ